MVDIDKIERAARAATPGVWSYVAGYGWWSRAAHRPPDFRNSETHDGRDLSADELWILNADPPTILKLIAVVRAAKAMTELYDKLALVLPGTEPAALREALEALK